MMTMGFYVRPSEAASYERSEDNQRKDLHRFMDHDGSNRRYDNSLSEQNPKLTVCILVPVVWIGILCPIVGGSLLFVVSWFHISHQQWSMYFFGLGPVLKTYRQYRVCFPVGRCSWQARCCFLTPILVFLGDILSI